MNIDSYSKVGINGNCQSCKKSKCWLLTLNNFLFKCDLNFKKINADSYSRGQN